MSSFAWLDYSERERRKMLEVVDLFKETGTRDELGIASVRDSFGDLLFPGTSTVMTRARYYLLVPWTYQRLEQKRVGSAKIADRVRREEVSLIEAIERCDDNEGNIGKYSRAALKRLPSSVYWHGLAVWGIREFPGSHTQYHRSLARHQIQDEGRRTAIRPRHDGLQDLHLRRPAGRVTMRAPNFRQRASL